MDQGSISITSLASLLETEKKPWAVSGDLCVVCGDRASGRHYGAISCEGCKGFFKRSIRKQLGYSCRGNKQCEVTKHHRNRCQFCRLQKCLQMGMRSDSVQHERKPLSNNAAAKRESTEALSPTSFYASLLDGTPYGVRSNFMTYDNSYQDDEESESANESDTERTSIAKAIEMISSVICDSYMEEDSFSSSSTVVNVDKEIVPEDWIQRFTVSGPSRIPANGVITLSYVCETSCRLLFNSVYWARSLPAFQNLSSAVQSSVMKNSWSDLFAIGLVQSQSVLPLPNVVSALLLHLQQNCTSSKLLCIAEYVSKLKCLLTTVEALKLDDFEYACVKAISLFSPDRYIHNETSGTSIREIQKLAVRQLMLHIQENVDNPHERLGNLLLIIPQVRSITSNIIEEVFFSTVLGSAQIESLIPLIMKLKSDLTFKDLTGTEGLDPDSVLADSVTGVDDPSN